MSSAKCRKFYLSLNVLPYENIHMCHLFQSAEKSEDLSRLILVLHPANERRHYKVTQSLIGWAET